MSRAPIARARRAAIALVALTASLAAQGPVIKPTSTRTMTRLAAPSPVVGKQQADGSILVTWRAIPGAATYRVTRSVPPTPAQIVANPTDTTYVDTNVQPGSYHYYVVAAVDSSGGIGLNSGSQPVIATATVAPTLVASGPTGSTGGGTSGGGTTPAATLAAPVQVDAIPQGTWPFSAVFFAFKQSGLRYRIERSLMSSVSKTPTSWQVRQTTGPLACCISSILDTLTGVTGPVMYRVTAIDAADPSITSPPTTSAFINSSPYLPGARPTETGFYLPAAMEVTRTDKVGAMLPFVGGAILDQNGVLGVDSRGLLTAKAPGVAHYLWGSLSQAGAPMVQLVRITVIP